MIDVIGWTLVHASWQGGVIAAAVAVALGLTRRASASTRYLIALVGLGLTVAAPIATTWLTFATGPVSGHAISTAGNLVVQIDVPAVGSQPAKRTLQRFRRA